MSFEGGQTAPMLPARELLERGGKFIQYVRYGCERAPARFGTFSRLGGAGRSAFAKFVQPLLRNAR